MPKWIGTRYADGELKVALVEDENLVKVMRDLMNQYAYHVEHIFNVFEAEDEKEALKVLAVMSRLTKVHASYTPQMPAAVTAMLNTWGYPHTATPMTHTISPPFAAPQRISPTLPVPTPPVKSPNIFSWWRKKP